MSFFISLPFVNNPDNENNYYESSVNITDVFRLINLTYQNILSYNASNPLAITVDQMYIASQTPTLFQTSSELLIQTGYKFPVYTYVWQLNLENPGLSTVVIHPRFSKGTTAQQADVITGTNLGTYNLTQICNKASESPYSYRIQYVSFYWPNPENIKRNFFILYSPYPNLPYNNNPMSPNYNPLYAIGSGLLNI